MSPFGRGIVLSISVSDLANPDLKSGRSAAAFESSRVCNAIRDKRHTHLPQRQLPASLLRRRLLGFFLGEAIADGERLVVHEELGDELAMVAVAVFR